MNSQCLRALGVFFYQEIIMKIKMYKNKQYDFTRLALMLEKIIEKSVIRTDAAVTVNFRDEDYSAESGGYHPVEIRIESDGVISYITDFCYVGQGWCAELTKEVDFDFGTGVFYHLYTGESPIAQGAELFKLWCGNFINYYESDVYTVSVSTD